MKNYAVRILLLFIIGVTALTSFQSKEPWTAKQMMSPYDLKEKINSTKAEKLPLILSVGPEAVIKGSVDIGAGQDPANIKQLKETVKSLPKDTEIIIYCGCCPLHKCPNVRPAFTLLNDMGFTNPKLLAILDNIKIDWIDKGYPIQAPVSTAK